MNERVRAVDWLRGIAVLVMIQTHSLSLLRPELRRGPLFSRLQWIDGLVAPAFIFAAGFAMALVQCRAAAAGGPRGPRVRKTLRRIGEVVLVATLMQWMWFPLLREPKWLLRIDILMCIAVSLMIALPFLVALAPRPRVLSWVSIALAAIVFGAAPLLENVGGFFGHFVSHKSGSVFPVFPWAGYVYLGAAAGAATAVSGARGAALWLAGICAAGIAIWLATPFFQSIYGQHEFWVTNPANCARRFTQVTAVALVLLAAEKLTSGSWQRSPPVRFVEVFGTSSLAGYFWHEALLYYQVRGISFHALWGERATWPRYWALLALLVALTFVLTWITDRVYARFNAPRKTLAVAALALFIALPARASGPAVVEPIFDAERGLGSWQDYGWAPRSIERGQPASLDLSDHGGWILARPGLQGDFGGLTVRFRAPASFGDFLEVRLDSSSPARFPAIGIARGDGAWTDVYLPMARLNPDGAPFDRIVLRARERVSHERVLFDRIGLTAPDKSAPPPPRARTVELTIDCAAPGHRISPLIYGVGVGKGFTGQDPQIEALGATARRWGGNASTRYNWQLGNAWNTASDWFFMNVNYSGRADFTHETFLKQNRAASVATALTVPTIGWVAKDAKSYSFPVSHFGPQQKVAPENPDAGNGVDPSGKPLPPLPPTQTSVPMPPEGIERWVRKIRKADGDGPRSVRHYILDNEPMLWNSTHRDVHPKGVTYDELLERTVAYGSAVRGADPQAIIAGPAEWGWTGYLFSAADKEAGFRLRPDRLQHLNVPILPWLLRKLAQHEKKTGVRVLDLVDVHVYPQHEGAGVYLSGDTSPEGAAKRIRSTRALWDPTYRDESWIDDTVKLIPRLREWIAENNPGLGISIGEWNFGAEGHISGGLAVAEALGHFGVEGIDSAFYWDVPPAGSAAFHAFRAFRNYDGKGARFLDESIRARSADASVSIFASRGQQKVVAVLLNLDAASTVGARIDAQSCGTVIARRIFTYAGGPEGPREQPSSGDVTLPAYSMTVVELGLGAK